jgi:hypothetical protein
MKTLDDYLSQNGDSFDKLVSLTSAIQSRIDRSGLNAWDSPDSQLDSVSTWEERAIVRVISFYCNCSNSGRIYPCLDEGLSLTPEFEAIGAATTLTALHELDQLRNSEPDLEESKARIEIESQVPGDFEWAEPILNYVRAHSDRFLQHQVV